MRCASPPLRLGPARSSVRYSRPTSNKKRKRLRISRSAPSAMVAWLPVRPSASKCAAALETVMCVTSAMLLLAMRTARLSGRRRRPSHVWQWRSAKYLAYCARIWSDLVSW